MLKEQIRKVVPYWAVESARRVLHYGWGRSCNICGASVRHFLPQGKGYPILERLQIVGGMYKREDCCPICHANDRDRLVVFYLDRHVFTGAGPKTVLHAAPEKGLTKYFLGKQGIDYVTGDLEPERYWHLDNVRQINLLDLAFETNSQDLVICNHILEHIPDDRKAMSELFRVLSPGGRAILQVPISLRLDKTIEGDGSESKSEKIRLYGQEDHVRIYTRPDYVARLQSVGFDVECYEAFVDDEAGAAEANLNPLEVLFVCKKPAAH